MIDSQHGVMFQQKIILRLIEQLTDLLTAPHRNRRAILEQFRAVVKIVRSEPNLPDYLNPDNIQHCIWDNRIMIDDILFWCIRVHRYYDDLYSSNMPR
jgi:hypothetical protein